MSLIDERSKHYLLPMKEGCSGVRGFCFIILLSMSSSDCKITDRHYTEDFGSGSFILLTEGKTPEEIDLYDTAEGVFSLSSSWNITKEGKVFYVLGNQVSKTPPTGMSITKGSFMIYGKKEYIPIHQTILGYGLWEEKELMLAPYRIIQRLDGPKIKILPKPNVKKMKGKVISDFLKKKLDIDIKNIPFLFSKPCILF